jgi:hypothetical protein
MAGGRTVRWPADSTRVNVDDSFELEFWSKRFGVSRSVLKQAVQAVGQKFKDVHAHLNSRRCGHPFG